MNKALLEKADAMAAMLERTTCKMILCVPCHPSERKPMPRSEDAIEAEALVKAYRELRAEK